MLMNTHDHSVVRVRDRVHTQAVGVVAKEWLYLLECHDTLTKWGWSALRVESLIQSHSFGTKKKSALNNRASRSAAKEVSFKAGKIQFHSAAH